MMAAVHFSTFLPVTVGMHVPTTMPTQATTDVVII